LPKTCFTCGQGAGARGGLRRKKTGTRGGAGAKLPKKKYCFNWPGKTRGRASAVGPLEGPQGVGVVWKKKKKKTTLGGKKPGLRREAPGPKLVCRGGAKQKKNKGRRRPSFSSTPGQPCLAREGVQTARKNPPGPGETSFLQTPCTTWGVEGDSSQLAGLPVPGPFLPQACCYHEGSPRNKPRLPKPGGGWGGGRGGRWVGPGGGGGGGAGVGAPSGPQGRNGQGWFQETGSRRRIAIGEFCPTFPSEGGPGLGQR